MERDMQLFHKKTMGIQIKWKRERCRTSWKRHTKNSSYLFKNWTMYYSWNIFRWGKNPCQDFAEYKAYPGKIHYVVNHGIVPYFKTILKHEIILSDCFVVSFDESLNQVTNSARWTWWLDFEILPRIRFKWDFGIQCTLVVAPMWICENISLMVWKDLISQKWFKYLWAVLLSTWKF